MIRQLVLLSAACMLSACQSDAGPPGTDATGVFEGIGTDETVYALGNEPFWNAEFTGTTGTYATPEAMDGTVFPVERFAGNNGLALTGTLDGANFDLTVTPGECSDTMSERTYPYVATLMIGGEQRNGCAWTDRQPFEGLENP